MIREKSKLMDSIAIEKALVRIAHEIIERNKDITDLALVGIKRRGVYLADRLFKIISSLENKKIRCGSLDITLYRDDLTELSTQPVVEESKLDFDITDKKIVLVDDVLFTGRTIRCALSELVDFGRPKEIQLAVLIDRGHRELPIKADYVGKNVPTSLDEIIEVRLTELDGKDEVVICEKVVDK